MEAFALFNAILIWAFLLFVTWLALRQHWRGNTVVWAIPVTALAWASSEANKLPPPVTAGARSVSKSPREKDYGLEEERGRSAAKRPTFRQEPSYIKDTGTPATTPGSTPRGREQYIMWMPHMGKNGGQETPDASPPQRSYSQRQLNRGDSSRQPQRQDSGRSQPQRQDSSRSQPQRQDSSRSQPPRAYPAQRQESRDRSRDRSLQRNESHPPRAYLPRRQDSRGRERSLQRNESHPPRAPPQAHTTRPPIYDTFQRSSSPRRPGAPQRKDTWGRNASPRRK